MARKTKVVQGKVGTVSSGGLGYAFKKKPNLKNPPTRNISRYVELKNIDTSSSGIVFGQTTASLSLLNGCDDGTSASQRSGRRITMRSLAWKFNCTMAATTTGASAIRNLIVYDRQPNAAAPTAGNVLTSNSITSLMNLQNSRRFVILLDKLYNGIGTAGPQSMMDSGYMKLNLDVEFNDQSTNDITSITTGSVYLLQYQDGNLLVASPTNNFFSRIRFEDF